MTTNDIRKLVSNNQLQQALTSSEQLELPDDFKSKLIAVKASYREYNNHRIDGDMRNDDIEIMRAGITKRIMLFLSEFEIVCLVDLKNNFMELTDKIDKNAVHDEKEKVVEEAKQITGDLESIDVAEKKEDVKPGVIKRIGDFLAKFQDKDSTQSKVLSTVKDGMSMIQQLGKKYNSVAQWFLLPQIPNILL